MESIIQTFHIDWKLMLAQAVNFGVVVFVLWFFALKPLAKKMEERTKKIDKGLKDADKMAKALKEADEKHAEIVKEARQESQKIMEETKALANREKGASVSAAKEQVEKIVKEGKARMELQKETMMREVKLELSELVMLATSKVLEGMSDKKLDQKAVEEAIEALAQKK